MEAYRDIYTHYVDRRDRVPNARVGGQIKVITTPRRSMLTFLVDTTGSEYLLQPWSSKPRKSGRVDLASHHTTSCLTTPNLTDAQPHPLLLPSNRKIPTPAFHDPFIPYFPFVGAPPDRHRQLRVIGHVHWTLHSSSALGV